MPETKEKTYEEVLIGRDKRILYHGNTDGTIVKLVNPVALSKTSASELTAKLRSHIGRIEFEEWFASNLLGSAMTANANHNSEVELDWINSDLFICFKGDSDWTLLIDASTLKSALASFEIFEVVSSTTKEIKLKYVG